MTVLLSSHGYFHPHAEWRAEHCARCTRQPCTPCSPKFVLPTAQIRASFRLPGPRPLMPRERKAKKGQVTMGGCRGWCRGCRRTHLCFFWSGPADLSRCYPCPLSVESLVLSHINPTSLKSAGVSVSRKYAHSSSCVLILSEFGLWRVLVCIHSFPDWASCSQSRRGTHTTSHTTTYLCLLLGVARWASPQLITRQGHCTPMALSHLPSPQPSTAAITTTATATPWESWTTPSTPAAPAT